MTNSELIRIVSEETGFTLKDVAAVLEAQTIAIRNSLVSGEDVRLKDLGILKSVPCAARTARNPQTGASIEIPARNAVRFKVAKSLKDVV